jgi:uncharacterized protein (TIGR02271 family)
MKEQALHPSGSVVVRDKDGVSGVMSPLLHAPSDASQVLVRLENGRQVVVPASALVQQPDGSYFLPLRLAELEYSGSWRGADNPLVIPVVAEQLDVQKRVVETGKVRITKVVREREALVDESLVREEVEITRVPIQRVVDGPIPVRYEDDTVVISILEEVLVVEKRLMLKEELHIRKQCREAHQPQQITLRSEEARIERLNTAENT